MRANTDRSSALAFGALADHYDLGRPRLSPRFVSGVTARLRSQVGGRQLEVGQERVSSPPLNGRNVRANPKSAAGRRRVTLPASSSPR
jgi:hypothetical protein